MTAQNRTYDGVILPPAALTPCGRLTASPSQFLESAVIEARRIRDLAPEGAPRILDVGCGAGRLAIGLIHTKTAIRSYRGIDVSKDRVNWCTSNITATDSRFEFAFLDINNRRYNPKGKSRISEIHFNEKFDVIYLYSVFSHMMPDDVEAYLTLFKKILDTNGKLFLTLFVADGVPSCVENPRDFGPLEWRGSLHCVLYNREVWKSLVSAHGFEIIDCAPNVNIDQQTGYTLRHRPS